MRKPLPGAVNRLLEGDLNRGEKVAGERGWSAAVLMSSSTRNKRFLFVLCFRDGKTYPIKLTR
jgi:hypothetical protein